MTCTHPRIITYHDADTGLPVQLWACAECGRRFEPLQLDETALLQQALAALEIGRDYAFETAEQFHIEMRGYKQQRHDAMDADVKQIDEAISALRARLHGDNLSPTANLTKTS